MEQKPSMHDWWAKRRWTYNKGLIAAGILAFIAYAIVGSVVIPPEDEFEITLFTILFQGIGYCIMIGIANLFYFLGPLVDGWINKNESEQTRRIIFALGYWFSVALPFSIPVLLVVFNILYLE